MKSLVTLIRGTLGLIPFAIGVGCLYLAWVILPKNCANQIRDNLLHSLDLMFRPNHSRVPPPSIN